VLAYAGLGWKSWRKGVLEKAWWSLIIRLGRRFARPQIDYWFAALSLSGEASIRERTESKKKAEGWPMETKRTMKPAFRDRVGGS